jgi:hypothetical protein
LWIIRKRASETFAGCGGLLRVSEHGREGFHARGGILFSGGLDSFAGTVEQLAKHGKDFDQLSNATPAQQQEQQQVKSIATSWTLKPGDVALLDRVAGELLWRHPCFRALVADVGLRGNPETDPPPDTRCPVKKPPGPVSPQVGNF